MNYRFSTLNRSFALLLACILTTSISSKVIVFDVGKVLFSASKWGMGCEIGLWDLIRYKLSGGDIKATACAFMESSFSAQPPVNPNDAIEAHLYALAEGIRMPQIWCDVMRGVISGPEAYAAVCEKLHSYPGSSRKKRLIKNFAKAVFCPAILATHMHPIYEATQLVADCARQHDTTLMILSNFDADAFDLLKKKEASRCIFDNFKDENIIVSGVIGFIKPEPAIYDYLKTRLVALDSRFDDINFLAQNCVFIDDQIENIIGARKAGITSLWLENGDYHKIRGELARLGFL